jgi:hypothetical protein
MLIASATASGQLAASAAPITIRTAVSVNPVHARAMSTLFPPAGCRAASRSRWFRR